MDITIKTTDEAFGRDIVAALAQAGFAAQYETDIDHIGPCHGYAISRDALNPLLLVLEPLTPPVHMQRDLAPNAMQLGLGDEFAIDFWDITIHTETDRAQQRLSEVLALANIVIHWPLASALDGRLQALLAKGVGFNLRLHSRERSHWQDLVETLRTWSFDEIKTDADCDEPAGDIHYGGAPQPLSEAVGRELSERYGIVPRPIKPWGEHDNDVWVYLPEHPPVHAATSGDTVTDAPFDIAGWLGLAPATVSTAPSPLYVL